MLERYALEEAKQTTRTGPFRLKLEPNQESCFIRWFHLRKPNPYPANKCKKQLLPVTENLRVRSN